MQNKSLDKFQEQSLVLLIIPLKCWEFSKRWFVDSWAVVRNDIKSLYLWNVLHWQTVLSSIWPRFLSKSSLQCLHPRTVKAIYSLRKAFPTCGCVYVFCWVPFELLAVMIDLIAIIKCGVVCTLNEMRINLSRVPMMPCQSFHFSPEINLIWNCSDPQTPMNSGSISSKCTIFSSICLEDFRVNSGDLSCYVHAFHWNMNTMCFGRLFFLHTIACESLTFL